MGRKERGSELGSQGNREAHTTAKEGREGKYTIQNTFNSFRIKGGDINTINKYKLKKDDFEIS